MDEDDCPITITISLRQVRMTVALVEGGIYRDVQPILAAIYAQSNAQILAARERAAAAAVAAAIQEVDAKNAASQSENPANESPDDQSNVQRTALH
jgi:hypothetical protein